MAGLAKKRILVICGPTAGGKSELALQLSRLFNGEMVCADSMQVYKGLTVGTAALLPEQAEGVPQHLVGILPPEKNFSVAEYLTLARGEIAAIHARGALPVVCGGTGLYISGLIRGIQYAAEPKENPALRSQLQEEWEQLGPEKMLQRLGAKDPAYAARLHTADKRRILRALEAYTLTGKTALEREAASRPEEPPYNTLCLGLTCNNRQALYQRINQRVAVMLDEGLLQEAQLVYQNRKRYITAAQAIGYKELFPYFEGAQTLAECTERLQQATRNYAKRQLTWFRHMPEVAWLYRDEAGWMQQAVNQVESFLQQ